MIYELGSGSAASTPHVSPPATTKPVTSTPDTSPAKAWNDAVAQAKANSPQQSANTPAEVVTGVNNSGIKPIITAMAYANAADQNLQETEQNAAKLHVRDASLFSDGETQSTNSWNTVEQKTINMLMSNNGGAYPEQAAAAEVKQLNALEPGNAKFAAANNAALTEATKQWQQMGVTKPQLSPIINAYSNAKRATNPASEQQAKNQLNAAIEKSLTDAANRAGSNPHARAKAMTERAADIQMAGPQDPAFRAGLDNANYDLQVTKPAQQVAKAYNTALVEGRANGLLPDDATTAAAAAAANELKTVTQNAGNSYYAGQIIRASHGTIDTITKDMGSIASEPLRSPGTVLEFNQIYGDLSQSVAAANTANASGLSASGKDAADLVANCIAKNIPPNLTLDQGSIYDEAAIDSIGNGDGTGLSLATAAAVKQQGQSDLAAFLTVGAARGLQGFASSVTKALTNYQQKTANLNWLIANLGGGATPQQLNTAIQHYINQQGPAWKVAYQQDKTILQASGQNLAVDIAQLEALPSALKTPEVNSTLKSLAGNQSVQQAIGFALANDPVSLVGSDGNQGEALAKFLELDKGSGELAKSSAELATAISQVYLKDHVEPQLLRNLQGLQPGSAKYDAAIAGTLQSFMERHPAMAAVAGLNGESIKKLSQLLPTDPLNKSTSPQQLETEVSGKLELLKKYEEEKGFSLSASHLFNSVALVVGSVGFFGAVKQAINKPDPASVFGAFTAALGFSQSAASAAGLFEKAPSQLRDFSNGESALGDLAGKVINGANLVANIGNLAAALQDGNTLGVVGSSAGAAGTLLKLVPEELVGDALQGGLDIGSMY